MIEKILSGGQTGVDRAALDMAINLGIDHFGWCPKGRRAEDGVIPLRYSLKETESEGYEERTLENIRDSDATLILIGLGFSVNTISDGTKLTVEELNKSCKPYLIIEVSDNHKNEINVNQVINWLRSNEIKVLNIAGPRESTVPGIYDTSANFLNRLFSQIKLRN
jgi:hypothetical protein